MEEATESGTSSSETKSTTPEEKQKSEAEDSLMQLNVVKAPSVLASARDDDSWADTSENDEPKENSYSSSSEEEEISKAKQSSNTTESSEDIMFTRNIEESYIQFGSSLADVVSIMLSSPTIVMTSAILWWSTTSWALYSLIGNHYYRLTIIIITHNYCQLTVTMTSWPPSSLADHRHH